MDAPERIGNYKLSGKIATGGMAEIYKAETQGPEGFNKTVVIKRILPHYAKDPHFVEMFLDEARLVAQLSHPKIAQIYSLGQDGKEYFIAMEWVDGFDLNRLVETCRASEQLIPTPIAIRMICDVLDALDYAHDYQDSEGRCVGIVHRDVTPHNILLSADGVVKLVDFGVAKAAQQRSRTQTGAVKGKFAYMAPEQIEGGVIDRRADVFACGIVLYELLTCQKPFGEDLAAVVAIQNHEAPNPRRLRRELPTSLVKVVRRALQKNRENRYQDAHEMRVALEEILRNEFEYIGDRELKAFASVCMEQTLQLGDERWTNLSIANSLRTTEPLNDVDPSDSDNYLKNLQKLPHIEMPSGAQTLAFPSEPLLKDDVTDGWEKGADAGEKKGDVGEDRGPDASVGAAPTLETTPPSADASGDPLDPSQLLLRQTQRTTTSSTSETDRTGAIPPKRTNSYLWIALFAASLTLGLLLLLGYVASRQHWFASSASQVSENPAKSAPTPTSAAKTSRFDLTKGVFDHPKGRVVRLVRKTPVELFYDGESIGTTPIQTRLKPGDYTVKYKVDGKLYQRKIVVRAGEKPLNIFLDRRKK